MDVEHENRAREHEPDPGSTKAFFAPLIETCQSATVQLLMENIKDIVLLLDSDGVMRYVSPAIELVAGYKSQELVGLSPFSLIHPEDKATVVRRVGAAARKAEHVEAIEFRLRHKDGNWLTLEVRAKRIFEAGTLRGIVATGRDITERKEAEEIIRSLALHDSLTGLPNRRLLVDRIEMAVAQAEQTSAMLAVMFIDLDHFKQVNDLAGHDAGDQVLIDVGEALRRIIRTGDTVARLGGDEFCCLLTPIDDRRDAETVAERISGQSWGTAASMVTASVGVAVAPGDGGDAATLLFRADLAMYQSKRRGRASYTFYSAAAA